MIRNNLKTIFRHFWRNKAINTFSILGLSLGLTVFLYVFSYTQYEFSYDKHLKDANKIYRLHVNSSTMQWARSIFVLGDKLCQELPEVEESTSFIYSEDNTIIDPASNFPVNEKYIICIDRSFIEFFGLNLMLGNEKAIEEPNTAIITQEMATKYFGNDDPIGKELEIKSIQYVADLGKYTVVGVVKQLPSNTHFRFNILLSQKGSLDTRVKRLKESMLFGSYTYLKIADSRKINDIETYAIRILENHFSNFNGPPLSSFKHDLQPLVDIHLKSNLGHELKPTNSIKHVFLVFYVGLTILIISLLNFVILHSTQILKRGKEIAFKKVSGANMFSLLKYFTLESFIYTLFSFYAASIIVELIRPLVLRSFNIDIPVIYHNAALFMPIIILAIIIIFIFDLFTMLLIRKINIIDVFKLGVEGKTRGDFIRKTLTTIQFIGAIGLLIFAFSVYKQIEYIQSKDLGFKSKDVIILSNENRTISQESMKQELQKISGVNFVTRCQQYPTYPMNVATFPLPKSEELPVKLTVCDEDYLKVMGIKVLQDFDNNRNAESQGVYINEKLFNAALLAYDNNLDELLSHPYRIEGVINNFHYSSLHSDIEPYFIDIGNENSIYKFILLSIDPKNFNHTINEIKNIWYKHYQNQNFNYTFLDDSISNQYKPETQLLKSVKGIIAIILIIISMGLWGTISLIMKNRRLEIGIRKTLGASFSSLIKRYIFSFSVTVIIAFFIASPIMYFIIKNWYADFQYKTNIQLYEFIIPGLIILVYSWVVTIWKIFKSVKENPIESLRYE